MYDVIDVEKNELKDSLWHEFWGGTHLFILKYQDWLVFLEHQSYIFACQNRWLKVMHWKMFCIENETSLKLSHIEK